MKTGSQMITSAIPNKRNTVWGISLKVSVNLPIPNLLQIKINKVIHSVTPIATPIGAKISFIFFYS